MVAASFNGEPRTCGMAVAGVVLAASSVRARNADNRRRGRGATADVVVLQVGQTEMRGSDQ